MKYNKIVQVKPAGNRFARCFDHVAAAFAEASGLPLEVVEPDANICDAIIIGGHVLKDGIVMRCVFWNTEQVDPESPWFSKYYMLHIVRNHLWDYSEANIKAFSKLGVPDGAISHVPLGYSPCMADKFTHDPEGVPVFYGSINYRRRKVIDRCGNMLSQFGVFGGELSDLIARARVVVNVHFYNAAVFEIVRCSELFASGVPVISEESSDGGWWEERLPKGTFCPYEQIPERVAARDYPSGEDQRAAFEAIPMREILTKVL